MEKIKCLVCGMQINEENFNFNENAFLNKNEKTNIKYCPFCGVTSVYLSKSDEVFAVDTKKLDEKTLKILDHAMKLEIFNADFYLEAYNLAEKEEVKKIFHDLHRIEKMHAKVHQRIGGFSKLPDLSKLDYSQYKGKDDELLEEAEQREEHAVRYYERYEKEVSEDMIRKIFKALLLVEQDHIILTNCAEQ